MKFSQKHKNPSIGEQVPQAGKENIVAPSIAYIQF